MSETLTFPTHLLNTVIKDRIVYQHAIRDGKGVIEHKPHNRNACQEMKNTADELVALINQHSAKELT